MYLQFIEGEDTIKGKNSNELIPEATVPEEIIKKNNEVVNKGMKVGDLIAETENLYNIKFESLKGRAGNKQVSKIKEEFVRKLIKYKLLNQKQLSELLEVSEQTISRIVNKV